MLKWASRSRSTKPIFSFNRNDANWDVDLASLTLIYDGFHTDMHKLRALKLPWRSWPHLIIPCRLNWAKMPVCCKFYYHLNPWWVFFFFFFFFLIRDELNNFADDVFKYIFLDENVWISTKISLKFVPEGPINDIPDNGLAPTRRQAIIWTNDGLCDQGKYASLGLIIDANIVVPVLLMRVKIAPCRYTAGRHRQWQYPFNQRGQGYKLPTFSSHYIN